MRKQHARFGFLTLAGWVAFVGMVTARQGLAQWCPIPKPLQPTPAPAPGAGSPNNGPHPLCAANPQCPDCQNSPCFAKSGAYTINATDLSLQVSVGSIDASRVYQSNILIDGPLGIGWTLSLTSRIVRSTYATGTGAQTEADIIFPNGMRYRFTENPDGTHQPSPGRYDVLIRNADGSYDMTVQHSRSAYHFGTDGNVATATDDYGNSLSYTYDGNGRVQQVADLSGSGRYINVFWGGDGRISSVQDSTGRQVQYQYTNANLTAVIDPAGRTTHYSYAAGRFVPLLTGISDNWNRTIDTATYDMLDRVATLTEDGETYTERYQYPDNGTTTKTASTGNTWYNSYNDAGQVVARSHPVGSYSGSAHGTKWLTYDANGLLSLETDEVNVQTSYTYDSMGHVTSVTRDYQGPSAVRFDYTYDAGFPDKVSTITPKNPSTNAVDPNWQAWHYDYYPTGSPSPGALFHVRRVESDGATLDTMATYTYDSKGRIVSQTSATGGETDYVYDAPCGTGNLCSVTAPANNDAGQRPTTSYAYDAVGRVTSVTDPLGHATTYSYDTLGRVATVTLPKPSPGSPLNFTTTYTYDIWDAPSGLVFTKITDPNGNFTQQGYDEHGRLGKSIDALNRATTYTYTRGLLTSITDANGNVTSYAYDFNRLLMTTTFPDGQTETYNYKNDNMLNSKTNRRGETDFYSYDNLKRVVRKQLSNTESGYILIDTGYLGQKLTSVSDSTVTPLDTHTLSYDTSYRVSSVTQGPRGTLNYQYDAADQVTHMDIAGGPSSDYTRYADGSLDTITWSPVTGNFKYVYSLNGQYASVTMPNGQSRGYSYDDQGRLLQLANLHPTAGNLATYGYGYDVDNATGLSTKLGQRTSLTATVPSQSLAGSLTNYFYDNNYQLTQASYPNVAPFSGEVDAWTYDPIGNRLTNTVNGSTASYTYVVNGSHVGQRLSSDGTNAYTFDLNGNTLTKSGAPGNFTFGWDGRDRMTSITGAATATYGYDYQGRRRFKSVSGSRTDFLYDGLNLVGETGASTANYVFGPGIDEPLAMSRGGSVYYPSVDALGSVALVTDTAGAVQNSYAFDAWGQVKGQTGTLGNDFGYTGREFGEAGDWFYRARYYSPGIGRLETEDSENDTVVAAYTYAANSPTDRRDPSGHDAITAGMALNLFGAGGGAAIGFGEALELGAGGTVAAAGGISAGGAIILGGGAAAAICYAIPSCRAKMKCVTYWVIDHARCFTCGMCPYDPLRHIVCQDHASANFRTCWGKGWRPFPNPCPPPGGYR